MPRYGEGPRGPEWARPVFIIVLTLLLCWLAMSMKRHHFIDGARYNNRSDGTNP